MGNIRALRFTDDIFGVLFEELGFGVFEHQLVNALQVLSYVRSLQKAIVRIDLSSTPFKKFRIFDVRHESNY